MLDMMVLALMGMVMVNGDDGDNGDNDESSDSFSWVWRDTLW